MESWHVAVDFARTAAWPLVVAWGLWYYRRAIKELLTRSKLTLNISGIQITPTPAEVEQSLSDSLFDEHLSDTQWQTLTRIKNEGPIKFNRGDYKDLKPLRDAGLVRALPKGSQLSSADRVAINTLGRLAAEAYGRRKEDDLAVKN